MGDQFCKWGQLFKSEQNAVILLVLNPEDRAGYKYGENWTRDSHCSHRAMASYGKDCIEIRSGEWIEEYCRWGDVEDLLFKM